MAAIYYASVGVSADFLGQDVDHSGTATTAADFVEIRIGNGTYTPDRTEVLKAIERIERWVVQGGTKGAGANLPQPTGPN